MSESQWADHVRTFKSLTKSGIVFVAFQCIILRIAISSLVSETENMARLLIALATALTAIHARSQAADLSPLFPDNAWFVLGVDVKEVRQSPLGKKLLGTNGTTLATRRLLAALGQEDRAADLRDLAIDSILDRINRLVYIQSEAYAVDDFRLYLEGDIDDKDLERAIKGICERRQLPFRTERVGERSVHCAEGKETSVRVFRVDKSTIAIVRTAAAVTDVLDLNAGKKRTRAQKGVVEGARGIHWASTPMWLVVGENRNDDGVVYGRMVAGLKLAADAELTIRMESPDEKAAERCRQLLQVFQFGLSRARGNRLLQKLGNSGSISIDGTFVKATTRLSAKSLGEEYAKQKE